MTKIMLLMGVLVAAPSTAREIDWVRDWAKAERITLDIGRYLVYRPAYAEQFNHEGWVGAVALDFDLRLTPFLKWENTAHFEGTQKQVRSVGWQHAVVFDYFDTIQPYYFHHSQHIQEGINEDVGFPLEDRYGVRINFLLKN